MVKKLKLLKRLYDNVNIVITKMFNFQLLPNNRNLLSDVINMNRRRLLIRYSFEIGKIIILWRHDSVLRWRDCCDVTLIRWWHQHVVFVENPLKFLPAYDVTRWRGDSVCEKVEQINMINMLEKVKSEILANSNKLISLRFGFILVWYWRFFTWENQTHTSFF